MTTQTLGVTFRYSHTIGRRETSGPGFSYPMALAFGENQLMYVVSRGFDFRHDNKRVTICTVEEDYLGEFGAGSSREGSSPDGSLVRPTAIARDHEGRLYITDEWLNHVAIFTKDGDLIGKWGSHGHGDGQIDRPSGIVFDAEENLYLVDSGNNRVQKFDKEGKFLGKWGLEGIGDGEFNLPWGIDIDQKGDVYIVDWRNDRIQKFNPDGHFLMKFGHSGTGPGEFNRPTGVAVDPEGIVYVTDWGNDRLQVFDPEGTFITQMVGDATISKWGKMKLDASPDTWNERKVAHGIEREKLFWAPVAVEVDGEGRIYVVESLRHRIQVYQKISSYYVGLYDGGRL